MDTLNALETKAYLAWRALPHARKMALAEKAADLWREQLEKFPNVVGVGWGYRTKRWSRSKERAPDIFRIPLGPNLDALTDEPAVLVSVAKKWKVKKDGSASSIPRYLKVKGSGGQRNQVFLVPTDVQNVVDVRPQSRIYTSEVRGVRKVSRNSQTASNGKVCCLVRCNDKKHYAVSCCHVLGMQFPGGITTNVRSEAAIDPKAGYFPLSSPALLPQSINIGSQGPFGLDCALVEVGQAELVRLKAVVPTYERYIARGEPVPENFYVVVRDRLVAGKKLGQFKAASPYSQGIKFETYVSARAKTRVGDSGAPVVTDIENRTVLVGIHFAGTESQYYAFMLPIWQLFERPYFEVKPIAFV